MKGICLGRDDYIDADVSYFIGLVIARGTLEDKGSLKQLLIEFPYSNLKVEG